MTGDRSPAEERAARRQVRDPALDEIDVELSALPRELEQELVKQPRSRWKHKLAGLRVLQRLGAHVRLQGIVWEDGPGKPRELYLSPVVDLGKHEAKIAIVVFDDGRSVQPYTKTATRSTRPGVDWQITRFKDDQPWGHMDVTGPLGPAFTPNPTRSTVDHADAVLRVVTTDGREHERQSR